MSWVVLGMTALVFMVACGDDEGVQGERGADDQVVESEDSTPDPTPMDDVVEPDPEEEQEALHPAWRRLADHELTSQRVARRPQHAALPGGAVLSFGGSVLVQGNESVEATVAGRYDPVLDVWERVGDLPQGRFDLSVVPLGQGRVVVAGGLVHEQGPDSNTLRSKLDVFLYDDATRQWETLPPMPFTNEGNAPTAYIKLDGQRFAAFEGPRFAIYDLDEGAWGPVRRVPASPSASLTFPDFFRSGLMLPNGHLLLVHGAYNGERVRISVLNLESGEVVHTKLLAAAVSSKNLITLVEEHNMVLLIAGDPKFRLNAIDIDTYEVTRLADIRESAPERVDWRSILAVGDGQLLALPECASLNQSYPGLPLYNAGTDQWSFLPESPIKCDAEIFADAEGGFIVTNGVVSYGLDLSVY